MNRNIRVTNLSVGVILGALLFPLLSLLPVFSLLPAAALAEITSQPCPYSCKTLNLNHKHCKDWKEGSTCFVDDLRPSSMPPVQGADNLDRKVVLVNKRVLAGKSIEVSIPDSGRVIDHFDAVVKRDGGSTETELSASIGKSLQLGSKQVDSDQNHVLQFSANGTSPEGRDLILSARNGDVFVESVHVLRR